MSNATETTATTIPPCPSWCDAEQGHEYDTDIVSTGAIERHHNWDPPIGDFAAWASISACEISLGRRREGRRTVHLRERRPRDDGSAGAPVRHRITAGRRQARRDQRRCEVKLETMPTEELDKLSQDLLAMLVERRVKRGESLPSAAAAVGRLIAERRR
jgi:hypothetical protein